MNSCKECQFYYGHPESNGVCLRRAPITFAIEHPGSIGSYSYSNAIWPKVSCDNWCGEFEVKNNEMH